jgi:isoquinoline 1-oxidoreductase subunit beta
VNPDVITAQVEGAIGFALSAVLRNRITLSNGMVQQRNFGDYEPTRMREMPKVEVYIVKSSELSTLRLQGETQYHETCSSGVKE